MRDGAWVTALQYDCPWLAEDKYLPGVQVDGMARNKPFKSIIKVREDQMSLPADRDAREASLKVLLAIKKFYAAPPPGSSAVCGEFKIHRQRAPLDEAAMDRLIAAASAAVARADAPAMGTA